jgi:tetratricopeptide (TPR) repeat protein
VKIHSILALLLAVLPCAAKMAPERWNRTTEEERHQLTRAEKYFDQKEYKSALAEYELFLQLYTKSEVGSYAQLMFAECTRQLGQVNTAINEFRNVIDYFPDSIDAGTAQYSIGVCLTQSGDAEKAVKEFEKVIEKWPKEDFGAQARDEACTIYWRLGQFDKWLAHLEYLATGEYKDSQNLRMLSQHRLLAHRLTQMKMDEAFAVIAPAKAKDPLVVFASWVADALKPNEIPAMYGDKGKKALPEMAAQSVTFIEKRSTDMADSSQKAALALWCARIYERAGVHDKAKERFAALVKQSPENDALRTEYAGILRESGERGEARLLYHELKNQYAGDSAIAETYGEEKNWKSCVEAYQAMLGKYPDKVGAIQWDLAEAYGKMGKNEEAIAAFQQSQREPQSLFRIAECQGVLKQHDAAIQTLVGVLNFFKSAAPEAQYKMAAHYAAKGDKEAAIRTLKTVCKVYLATPWAGKAHQDLAHTYGVDVTLGGAAKKDEK